MFTGGAIIPKIAAIEMSAPASTVDMPIAMNIGATTAPAVSTDAVELPVIIPGTIITKVRRIIRSAGHLLNFFITAAVKPCRAPESRKPVMNIMAVAIVRIVSR